ncbi:hypothetical protein, partial [Oenococcus oeni]
LLRDIKKDLDIIADNKEFKTKSIQPEPFLITRKEVATKLRCSVDNFDRRIRYSRDFKDYVSEKNIGGKILFFKSQIDDYIENL